MAKKGKGRQKVAIEKMPDESARQVTFSKRRSGLVKKGSELCTLCGAEVALVIFSPGGKVYSFGHPSADTVIRRFLGEEPALELEPGSGPNEEIVQAHRCSRQSKLNFHLTQLESLVDEEKRKGEVIENERHETEGKVWWEKPIEELTKEQLELLMLKMREFKDNIDEEIHVLRQAEVYNGQFTSNVLGTGSHGDLTIDPKGKGLFDPMVHRSSGHRVPYSPMMATTSNQTPLDPSTFGCYQGLPYDRMAGRSSGTGAFDPMAGGSSGTGAFDPMVLRSASSGMAGGSSGSGSFDPMVLRSTSSGMAGGSSEAGVFDPMVLGSTSNGMASGVGAFDPVTFGSTSGVRSYNPDPSEFQGESWAEPSAHGSRNGGDWSFH